MATQNHSVELPSADFKPMRSWQEIAEEASKEFDGARLMQLTDELLAALCRDLD